MNNHIRRFFISVATLGVVLVVATAAFGQSGVKMSNGSYHPGVVLSYQNGSLEVATPSRIDRSETTYVLIHGAHTDSTNENLKSLARAIAAEDSDANILIVDWSYWSKLNVDRLEEIAEEQFVEFIIEVFIRHIFEDEVDMDEVVERHLKKLFERLFLNILPVEQTRYIPTVADRVYSILFGDSGDVWEFRTNGEKGSFASLGLNPKKTHLIGHSHGAHVAGLTAAKSRKELGKRVKRVTALDPSRADIHVAESNKWGSGWDRNVADFVDVWRTSELCSGDKLYGDVNVRFRVPMHPLRLFDVDELDADEALVALGAILACELELHSGAFKMFAEFVREGEALDDVDEDEINDEDASQWITIDLDDD